jgi:signal transduction histidine kinase
MTGDRPRILVVDDQETILQSFAALLERQHSETSISLDELEAALGGSNPEAAIHAAIPTYDMTYARQGNEAVRACETALARGKPLAMAFVDVHMPPGMDGVDTALAMWKVQPDLEIVLCTAHAIYSWKEILAKVPRRDQLLILRKPFDPIEVRQLAASLTEKWRRGRELAEQLAQLEARVQREVARRLATELASSQKFEQLGRLTAGIAHDLSTPAQYIASAIEYIDELATEIGATHELPQITNMQTAIAEATHGSERLRVMISTMRNYMHTKSEELEPLDINQQICLAAELARAEYRGDAELVLELTTVPQITGHPDQIGRAVMNLIVNAAHAIREKTKGACLGKITISSELRDELIVVGITDTGTGIAAEHRDRMFQQFFTTKPRGEGTGQGLAMVRSTMERHGGLVRFETTPGLGTRFVLEFPTAHARVAAA